jgi:RimJ/RimL family protein N-acetyltransferase
MSFRVRPASTDDLDALAALVTRANLTYRAWTGASWTPPGSTDERLHWAARLEDTFAWSAVAGSGGELLGCVSFTDVRANAGARTTIAGLAHLSRMFVDPAHWRAGVGTALLAAATKEMRRRRYERAQLFTAILNAGSRAFYERHGWRLGEETREWHGLRLIRYTHDL